MDESVEMARSAETALIADSAMASKSAGIEPSAECRSECSLLHQFTGT